MDSNCDLIEETTSAKPSFFKSSCPGIHCFSKTKERAATAAFTSEDRPRPTKRQSGGAGGYTCCVPGCYNDSKKQKGLSFMYFQLARAKKNDCYAKGGYTLYQKKILCQHQAIESAQSTFKGGQRHT